MTDFKISFRDNGTLRVAPVSVIAASLLMYYFGERLTNDNDDEVYEFRNLEHFNTFRNYANDHTRNRLDLIYTLI